MKKVSLLLSLCLITLLSFGQGVEQKSSGQIYEELQKFNFLGSVLYVAAHPDDENTRLISFLSNGLHARTAYLSLTRGDGGQNLIGTEIRELLGVLRSQELQMARATDGGQQFFTRANDFGYSKHPDETLRIWDKEKVFDDIIRAIRTFKPDIIINRFDHRTPGRTHGHHTSSAMLSVEAFDKSNDPYVYPYQLEHLSPWQVRRQFFNTSWWFYGSREKFAEADKTNLVSVDVGGFYPTLGISNNEISGLARSKHRSQGFGSSGSRGSYQEYLELINGDLPVNKENIFDGINTTWTRVEGGDEIQSIMNKVMDEFDFTNPSESVPALLSVYKLIQTLDDNHWRQIKSDHLKEIIAQCMGLFIEASTDQQQTTLGDTVEIQLEVTSRSQLNLSLSQFQIKDSTYVLNQNLDPFTENKWFKTMPIAQDQAFSNPYWLNETSALGIYTVNTPEIRNKPQSDAALNARISLNIEGVDIAFDREVIYKTVEPDYGEIREPFVVIPPATMSFDKEMYLLSNETEQLINVKVRASKNNMNGKLELSVPEGWNTEPASVEVSIPNKGMEKSYTFKLISPGQISEGHVNASITVDDKVYDKTLINITYDHIPLQTILLPASSKVVKVPLKKGGRHIAYIMGAGDKMPESLESVGYIVDQLETSELNSADLSRYHAVVIGIRAYNTLDDLWLYNQILYDYVNQGGTMVVQYNTSRRLNYDQIAPLPIKLSRNRVTDEFAEMRILAPEHQVINQPNQITSTDFDGWVQERGLYFAEEWDDAYTPILSCNDKGEDPLNGSLLVAPYGEGYFVYSSISWFRQLPAGVPGAYRLFANILALSSPNNRP